MRHRWLHRYAIFVAACTLIALIAGTFVTANEARPFYSAGASHSTAGAIAIIMAILLAVWLQSAEPRLWMRRLGWIVLAAFLIDGILGFGEPPRLLPLKLFHTLIAYFLLSATTVVALLTSLEWERPPQIVEPAPDAVSLRSLAMIATAAVVLQVMLGVMFRYDIWNVLPHILGAMVAGVLIGVTSSLVIQRYPKHRSLRRAAIWAMAFTFSQVLLGMAVLTVQVINPDDPVPVLLLISTHVASGALTLASSVVLTIQVHRYVGRVGQAGLSEVEQAEVR